MQFVKRSGGAESGAERFRVFFVASSQAAGGLVFLKGGPAQRALTIGRIGPVAGFRAIVSLPVWFFFYRFMTPVSPGQRRLDYSLISS